MANPKLTVEIEADIDKMKSALQEADNLLEQHQGNYNRVQTAIGRNVQRSRELEKSIKDLSNQFKSGAISESQFTKESDRLSSELREVSQETRDYQRELNRLDSEMDRVAAASKNYQQAAERNAQATRRQTKATQQLARTTQVNAVPAMTSFSQVVQDAPYGIQGVANNIQNLTMQFGYLQNNAGGTTAALKAMAGSLIGPAGVLFAVSVVTSLLVQFGDELFKSGEEAKTAAEKMNDYIDSLEGVQKAQVDARRSAAQELVQLRLLEQQATNTAISTDERRAAIEELKKQYPEYLSNMKDEEIMANGVRDAYDDISESIMRKARAQAAENIMVENYKQEIGYMEELLKLEQDLIEAEQSRDRLLASAEDAITFGQRSEWLKAAARQEENINDIYDRRKEIQDEITKAAEENTRLEQYVAEGGNLVVAPDYVEVDPSNSEVSTIDPIRVPIESVFDAGVVSTDDDLDIAIKRQIAELKRLQSVFPETAEGYRLIQAEIERLELRVAPLGEKLTAPLLQVRPVMQSTVDSSKEMADEVSQAAKQADRAFQGMVSGMVNSLIRGEFKVEDFVKNILSSLASIAITSMLGPAGGIFGGLFSQGGVVPKKGVAGSFSNGGVIPGSSNVGDKLLAFVNSGELILNKNQQKALYSALNTPQMVPVMNDEAIPIQGTTRIDGQDLMIVYERAERRRGRET